MDSFMSLLTELGRRNVVRVAIAYAIVAWLLIEIVATTFPILSLPDWAVTLVTALVLIGFPLALIFAWAFELTPEGIKLEKDVIRSESTTHLGGRRLDFAIIGLLAIALLYVVVDNYFPRDKGAPTESAQIEPAALPLTKSIAVRIGAIKTISRTSVMKYRDTVKMMPQIGEELGVATILEGGVQRAGDSIRINVQLIDAASDTHLWAQTYDRQLTAANIFAIQSEIARAIAEALRVALSVEEQQRLVTAPTESLPALEAYFLGKQRMATRATDDLAEAVDLLQRAIELDPEFALAYVALADTYTMQSVYAGSPADEMRAKSELAINKALELDSRLGEAYASLGLMKTGVDLPGAEAALKRALELNPNYASAHQWYVNVLTALGRHEEALVHAKAAVGLDPRSAIINNRLAWTYMVLGRYDEAMAKFKSINAIDPSFSRAYEGIGSLYRHAYGQLDTATRWYRKQAAVDPGNYMGPTTLAMVALDLGDEEQAEYWIGRSRELAPHGLDTKIATHLIHTFRGDDDEATIYAQRILDEEPRCCDDADPAAYLSDRDIRAGRYAEARARYEKNFPEMLTVNELKIDGSNYKAAIHLALILAETGDRERANALLQRSLAFVDTAPRMGFIGSGVSDVRIYALRGQHAEALAALRQAVDAGWRKLWWYYLKHDMALDSIRNEPEFQAMVKEIETDMAEQLAKVREWDADSELAPIPESLE
jgi:tetratricopeptide (TPR) repeat protein